MCQLFDDIKMIWRSQTDCLLLRAFSNFRIAPAYRALKICSDSRSKSTPSRFALRSLALTDPDCFTDFGRLDFGVIGAHLCDGNDAMFDTRHRALSSVKLPTAVNMPGL